MNFLRLFRREPPVRISDPDFGQIEYIRVGGKGDDESYWEMLETWDMPDVNARIQCVGIDGNESGPHQHTRLFLVKKKNDIQSIWDICSLQLCEQVAAWFPDEEGAPVESVFFLSALVPPSDGYWEACFETRKPRKWIYVSYQIVEDNIKTFTIDT